MINYLITLSFQKHKGILSEYPTRMKKEENSYLRKVLAERLPSAKKIKAKLQLKFHL
jgi:hypothetical protein